LQGKYLVNRKRYYYSFVSGYSKADSFKLVSFSDKIYIAGEKFQAKEDEGMEKANNAMLKFMKTTLWFSYKYNWASYIEDTKLNNDVGWGCMIRCGQMLMASAVLKKTGMRSEEMRKQYIGLCSDNNTGDQAPFGIHNIVKYAAKKYNITPGQWFRGTTIMMSLDGLNNHYKPPLTHDIRIFTSVDSLVNITEIYKKVFSIQKVPEGVNPLEELKTKDWGVSLLFCVAIRTGLNKPQANFKKSLAKLMELKQSVGFLGGKDHKAYYIVGRPDFIEATMMQKRNITI
jgi:cysteine protease ATG4